MPVEYVVASFGRDEIANSWAEERREWLAEVGSDIAAALDVDALEEGLVDLSPEHGVCAEVHRVTVLEEAEAGHEVRLAGVVVHFSAGETRAYLAQGRSDPVLLALEQVEGDRLGVVRLEELVALGHQPLLAFQQPFSLLSSLAPDGLELDDQRSLDRLAEFRLQSVPGMDFFDLLLDRFDENGAERALGELVVPAGADKVRVHLAGPAA
ncbi:MAG TPA: hypothetical protein VFA66_04435 [Gaiellaceae bacterium]|nr:hypothetical protein [Gaiellaceae bacterium]